MITRQLKNADTEHRRIVSPDGNWESSRLLLKEDGMGFSFHITTIYKGADFKMHYKNHLESVYCISGSGEVVNLKDGKSHPIEAGTIYILDKHDQHVLRCHSEMQLACVFNPPLTGQEVHDASGSYSLAKK